MTRLHRPLLLLTAALVLTALLLPGAGLHLVSTRVPWLGSGVSWLESVSPGLDLDHLLAFALLACSARLGLPRVPAWQVLAALALFAGITEVAQFWVPGRTASLADAGLDLAGALLGYTAGTTPWRLRPACR
jgi:hypothetical protein